MDDKTRQAYATLARAYSDDWHAQPAPNDMYALLEKHFIPGGTTADIGCGDGRDAHWLKMHHFKVKGFDASRELLAVARDRYPDVEFIEAQLPRLQEIHEQFDNVLCETVIMHLPREQIDSAVESLKRITRGVLYLSWRVTEGSDARHADGRLYSAFDPAFVRKHFDESRILHWEDRISESSKKRVCRLLVRKG